MQQTAEYTEALARLDAIGKRRTRLRSQLETAEDELREAIRTAAGAGVPKRVIARVSGVVRQTVYNVLDAAEDNGR